MTLGEVTNLGVEISLQPIGVKDREPNLTLLDVDGYAPAVTYWLSCHRDIKDLPQIRARIDYLRSNLFESEMPGSPFRPQA